MPLHPHQREDVPPPSASSAPGRQPVAVAAPHPDVTDQAVAVLTIFGDLDGAVTPRWADLVWQGLLAAPRQLIVDLRTVTFLGVDALRLLERAHRYATHRGTTLCLIDGTPPVNRALRAAGLDQTVPCFGSVEAARAMP